MAKLDLPKGYTPDFQNPRVKPVGDVEIDWDNPLTKGLKFYPVFVGDLVRDLISGQAGISSGTFESGYDFEGSLLKSITVPKVEFPDLVHDINDGPMTMLVRHSWSGGAQSFQTVISLPSNDELGMYLPVQAGNLILGSDAIGGATSNFTNATVAANTFNTYSVSTGGFGGTNDLLGYKNGLLTDTVSRATATSSSNKGVNLFFGQSTEHAFGSLRFAALWNRQLTNAEQLSFYNNPYQILKPKAAPVYWTVGGAGGISVNAESQEYNVNFFDASIDFTGLVAVSAESQAHSVTFFDGVVDLTGEVLVNAESQALNVTFFNATVTLQAGINVSAEVQNYNVNFFDGVVGLFGVIDVSAEFQEYNVQFFDANVTISPPSVIPISNGLLGSGATGNGVTGSGSL